VIHPLWQANESLKAFNNALPFVSGSATRIQIVLPVLEGVLNVVKAGSAIGLAGQIDDALAEIILLEGEAEAEQTRVASITPVVPTRSSWQKLQDLALAVPTAVVALFAATWFQFLLVTAGGSGLAWLLTSDLISDDMKLYVGIGVIIGLVFIWYKAQKYTRLFMRLLSMAVGAGITLHVIPGEFKIGRWVHFIPSSTWEIVVIIFILGCLWIAAYVFENIIPAWRKPPSSGS
jgi:hypothetical protein